VYRSATPGGPYTLLGSTPTTTGTTYTDTTAVAGTTYYYVVRGACDAGGTNESGNSNELSAARLVSPTPTITGASSNACPGTTVLLSTEAGQSNYQWYLGGSPIGGATGSTYTATASGSYTVSYTNASGCSGASAGKAVTIVACAPNIVYQGHGTITQVTGDGDAWYERGEKWSVSVTLTNGGNLTATNVTATFGGNGITVCSPTKSFGAIAPGGTATATFEFVIATTFSPCGGAVSFAVTNKTSTELTPAGSDESGVFSIAVGQQVSGSAAQLVIQPSLYDTYVNQNAATTNYGSGTTMTTNVRSSQERDVLVQFDLSGIPAGSAINSATLELYNTTAPASTYTVNVMRNTAGWVETSVTWNTKPAYDSTIVAQITPTTAVGWKTWTVTPAAQGWFAGTYANYGFTLKPNATSGSTNVLYTFATREYTTNTAYRPILRVNYTPMSWDCAYTGAGSCCAAPAGLTNNTAADLDLCSDTGVQITWPQDPSDWSDGGSGTRTYDVLRNGTAIATGLAYGTTSYTDTTGANGTSYTYAVRYDNGCGSAVTTTGVSALDNAPVCTALDQCHDIGTCDPGTGVCSNPAKANGTSCDDANACTTGDTCSGGTCVAGPALVCDDGNVCTDDSCNAATGCVYTNNTAPCNDGNACTLTDFCQAGACIGLNPVVCTPLDQCHDTGVCDSGTGSCTSPAKDDGTSCDDGSPYTTHDRCLVGTCMGEPVEVAPGDTPSDALGWSGTGVITWPPLPGATGYRLYRGGLADLPGLLNSGTDSCEGYQGSSTSANTPEVPEPGGFFWYIVTALNGALEGAAGNATAGPRVMNSSGACP
jgi:hypothetical protein